MGVRFNDGFDDIDGMSYRGAGDDGIGPSDIIWGQFQRYRNRDVRVFAESFISGAPTFASATSQGGMITYQDTGVTIKGSATADSGLEIAGNDADNDEGSVGSDSQVLGTISDAAAEKKLLAFEICVKKEAVGDNGLAFFAGLMEPGKVAANALVDDTGAVVDADYIGFSTLNNDGDSLDAVYKKAGQTAQDVEADCKTLVADTFVKLGLVYDPEAKDGNLVKFYVDGVDIGSYVTATDIAAATFPDSEDLGWIFATKVGAAAEIKANLRWVRFAQVR